VVASGALTLLYMFRTWQVVFQYQNKETTLTPQKKGDGVLAPIFLISLCVLLGLFAQPLISLAEMAAAQLAEPQIYIDAVRLFGRN
jgi:formate hydrogenlyase subunit 3/multisubunit Na+/H+ antiporter MnhD subunit